MNFREDKLMKKCVYKSVTRQHKTDRKTKVPFSMASTDVVAEVGARRISIALTMCPQ